VNDNIYRTGGSIINNSSLKEKHFIAESETMLEGMDFRRSNSPIIPRQLMYGGLDE
jgi:hypothetical protein